MYVNFLPHAIAALDEKRAFLKEKKLSLGTPVVIHTEVMDKEVYQFDRALCLVRIHGVNFECIHSNLQRGYKKLYVFFSSGGGRKKGSEFHRWTWYKYLPGICLHVEDPMFRKFPELLTTWFYGDQEHPYLIYISEYLKKFAELFAIPVQDITCIGSSQGAYAALYVANHLKGATAIAMNPQIRLYTRKKDALLFEQETGISLKSQDDFRRNNLDYIGQNTRSNFFVMANIACPKDYEKQLPHLVQQFDQPLQFPLTKIRNFTFFLTKTQITNPHHVYLNATMIPFVESMIRGEFAKDVEDYLALFLSESITNECVLKDKLLKKA